MLIDGKKIAEEIKESLKKEIEISGKKLKLAIVQVGENDVSKKFIERKIKFAGEIGVGTEIYNLPDNISADELCKKLEKICDEENSGVILQLPLPASPAGGPAHIDTQRALDSVVLEKDVDVLSSRSFGGKILTPVVGAIREILGGRDLRGKNVVVVGAGILVGKPATVWAMDQGAAVSVVNEFTPDISEFTKRADIIISGAGRPGLIKPEMVKEGVVIIDVAGDVEPAVAKKALIFTPKIGGVGPITVAMLFKNLVELNKY